MKWLKQFFLQRKFSHKVLFVISVLFLSSALLLLTTKQIVLASRGQESIFTTLKKIIQPQNTTNQPASLFSNSNQPVKLTFLSPTITVTPLAKVNTLSNGSIATPSPAGYTIPATPTPTPPANVNTIVTVNQNSTGVTVPPGFAGLSLDPDYLCDLITNNNLSSQLANEFKNLGSAVMRIGGGDADETTWPSNGNGASSCTFPFAYNKTLVDGLFAFARNIGWKVSWAVNLGTYDPTTYANEAAYVASSGGSSLLDIEIGNEPDLYSTNGLRSSSYTYTSYKPEWEAYMSTIKGISSNISFDGPDTAIGTSWFSSFASDEKANVIALTQHLYPTCKTCSGTRAPTIGVLLSQATMATSVSKIAGWVSTAKTQGVPFALDETNSVSGSMQGVSDTFAAALWGADYIFNTLEQGATRIDFCTVDLPTFYYNPIEANGTPKALYYGMLFFHSMAANGTTVPTTVQTVPNVTAHSVLGNDGKLRVAVINKDLTNDANVQITTPNTYSQATDIRLSAPSVTSTTGITLGGNAVASDGTWSAGTPEVLTLNGKSAYITVPAASAAIITFQ